MPYCPNPECPFRKRFGESAEFVEDTTLCSDCDTPLSNDDVLGPEEKTNGWNKFLVFGDFHKRLLWTLALLGFWRILAHLSLPGINSDRLADQDSAFRFTILALGLMPYITSYILVEILALFLPPLKRWREAGGYEGRARLVLTARWVTLAIAFFQGGAVISGIGRLGLLIDNSAGFRSLLVLTLVAGTFLTLWIADMISRKGIGHGISILILATSAAGLLHDIPKMAALRDGDNIARYFGLPLLAVIGLVILIIIVEKAHNQIPIRFENGTLLDLPLKVSTAGIVPVGWANSLISIPALFLGSLDISKQSSNETLQWLAGTFYPGSTGWNIAYSISIVIFYYIFTALFYRPGNIARYLKENTTASAPEDNLRSTGRSLINRAFLGGLYLILATFLLDIVWRLANVPMFGLNGLKLIVIVSVSLDLLNEIRIRWKSESLVKVAEFQEPWKAGLLQNVLHQQGIPSITRGYYHRALLYFFGPYIEVSTFVPRERQDDADAVIKLYLRAS